MACTLSNKCAKNLSKRTVLLQLIIKNVVTCFFWNTVYMYEELTTKILPCQRKKMQFILIGKLDNISIKLVA